MLPTDFWDFFSGFEPSFCLQIKELGLRLIVYTDKIVLMYKYSICSRKIARFHLKNLFFFWVS